MEKNMKKKVIIVGGGAAGMMAAAQLDTNLADVVLYEKNEKLGKKLFITGKGRCNLTNACDMETLFDNIIEGKRFMYSSMNGFNNFDVIDFFEAEGLRTKIERGNRVFPESDHSSDVIKTLEKTLKNKGVSVCLRTQVESLIVEDNVCRGVRLYDGTEVDADFVIVGTGGLSYPTTGSTGDGYRLAAEAGHSVSECFPSLVAMTAKGNIPSRLEGLSLKNVRVSLTRGQKLLYEDMGEMLFTAKGVSGPLILSGQAIVGAKGLSGGDVVLHIDLKPALTEQQLDARIVRDFSAETNRQFKNALSGLLPKTMVPVVVERTGISPDKQINSVSKEDRAKLIAVLKDFTLQITGTEGFAGAVVTRGGVATSEILPKTMESKKTKNLYFAGEVLDVDAFTGGFNLQIAWSTATAAARGINDRIISEG